MSVQQSLFDIQEKICYKCKKQKPLKDFYDNPRAISGKTNLCKECCKKQGTAWRKAHPERSKKMQKEWHDKNKERLRVYAKEYFKIEENRLRRNATQRKNTKKLDNHIRILAYQKEYKKNLRKTTKGALDHRMSRRMSKSLKGGKNGKHWLDLVPYNTTQLEKRLRKTIPKGYTWDDFLSAKLHIDHITPLCKFQYDSHEDWNFQKAWGLDNLQLLPAQDNIKKGGKIDTPVQMFIPLNISEDFLQHELSKS